MYPILKSVSFNQFGSATSRNNGASSSKCGVACEVTKFKLQVAVAASQDLRGGGGTAGGWCAIARRKVDGVYPFFKVHKF